MEKIIISLEGIDGAGKSTIAAQLKKIFGTKCSVYSRTEKQGFAKVLLSLKFIKKFTHWQVPIYLLLSHINYHRFRKISASSPIIIMDRCFLSNISYFFPRSLENSFLLKLLMLLEPKIYPQKIFVLDADPFTAQKRDNFQKELAWLTQTRNAYLQASESSLLKKHKITVIKDTYTIEQKTDIIANYIRHNLERTTREKKAD